MSVRCCLIAIGAVSTLAFAARGQQNVPATTVQLPSYSVFTAQTTVSVPDGGGAFLGGLNSGASNSSRFGLSPLGNRGLSTSRSASGMSVSATITDHAEIDRALLAEAAARRGTADPTTANADAKAAAIAKSLVATSSSVAASGLRSASAIPGSVAAIREENAAAADLQNAELAGYLAKARQAEADNKPGVAKVFYQMVARRDNGSMKKQATERLAYLTGGKR